MEDRAKNIFINNKNILISLLKRKKLLYVTTFCLIFEYFKNMLTV